MRNPTPGIDYTSKDYDGFRELIIAAIQQKMPEYTDLSPTDAGIVISEALCKGLDVLSYYQDIFANECFLPTLEQRENALKWANSLAHDVRNATPAVFEQVFVLANTVPMEDYLIPKGTVVKTSETALSDSIYFETVEDLIIPSGKRGDEQDLGKYLYYVLVEQGVSVFDEKIGGSDGSPNQTFRLHYSPVIVNSIDIYVNEGQGYFRWEQVSTFVDSNNDSLHYVVHVLDNHEIEIIFGNGVFGKIPNAFSADILANYRVGGGTIGNVGENTIVELDVTNSAIQRTFNPYPALKLGVDRESVDEIKKYAPVSYRTRWGALTLEDFSVVTMMNFPEVLLTSAVRDDTDIDDLHLYIVLKSGELVDADVDETGKTFKERLSSFYDENQGGRKIVGADDIFIEDAVLTPQNLTASLIVLDGFSRAAVTAQVEDYLNNFFAVGNYQFGQELSYADLAAQVMNPDNGIAGIKSFRFISDTEVSTPAPNEIFTMGNLSMNVVGGVA